MVQVTHYFREIGTGFVRVSLRETKQTHRSSAIGLQVQLLLNHTFFYLMKSATFWGVIKTSDRLVVATISVNTFVFY